MFVISITYTKPMSETEQLIEPHILYLNKYYALHIFLMSDRKEPRTRGVIIANCQDAKQCQQIIEEDPFYAAAVASCEITEFCVTRASRPLDLSTLLF
ncbi:MAG: hypothetical protein OFPII_16430 [Osedax symbiont Rs1]|nr:MAG: hypothetical protein OFPII_16430 [Osedax symbiont Rs1]